ncbi:hypothetical protein AKO1_011951 [Acrasis kona]|uniref:Uncharacterized protein n=1 Tax=Acrasis kona TaxID=1008807 RepID=A0AAW2Z9Y8_9EUKA
MTVVAEGSIDNMQVASLRAVPLSKYNNIPRGLVHYVMRIKEPVILQVNNCQEAHAQFSKEIINPRVRSVMCCPVVRSNMCKGVLYLENEVNEDAFSVRHAEIMSILTNQISMALENARISNVLESTRRMRSTTYQLEQTQKKLEEFIDILCHELRNPLAIICGNNDYMNDLIVQIQQLTSTTLDETKYNQVHEEAIDVLGTTMLASEQLKDMIDNVLTVSMLENKSVKLQHSAFDVLDVIRQAILQFKDKATEKNLTLEESTPSGELCVMGDAKRLKEILVNILTCCIKFNVSDKNKITVFCNEKDAIDVNSGNSNRSTIEFKIQVSGAGWDKDQMIATMIDSNESVPSSTSAKLGFKISRQLCELMGGSLQYENTSKDYMEIFFSVVFDLVPAPSTHNTDDDATSTVSTVSDDSNALSTNSNTGSTDGNRPRGSITNGKRALVVDDDPINQKILSRILRTRGGLYVDIASDGLEAVDMVSNNFYDIVMMDMEMPIMGGLEATAKIRLMESERKESRALPIIAVSGNADAKEKTRKAGMQGYVIKPYMANEIFSVVERLINV